MSTTAPTPGSVEALLLQHEIDQLNAAYAAALDEQHFDAWPEFFLPDASYKVQARENFDRGLPLALIDLEHASAWSMDRAGLSLRIALLSLRCLRGHPDLAPRVAVLARHAWTAAQTIWPFFGSPWLGMPS